MQVSETLSEDVLKKIEAPIKPKVPIADVLDLPKADGFVFAFPTRCNTPPVKSKQTGNSSKLELYACRYGIVPAQFKAFMDATGVLWQTGALIGKPVTFLTSTASPGGGQEVTILSS